MTKLTKEQFEYLENSLRHIDYGSILITVHNGKVTQIDATEKRRFTNQPNQLQTVSNKS
ncbi:MAG: YezD family protein [Bacilli bacterium]|nr:YezD family protein [Bacilli bacterium]